MRTPFAAILLFALSLSPSLDASASHSVGCLVTETNLLLVPGRVSDVELLLLMDSGSTHNVISSHVLSTVSHAVPKPIEGHMHIKAVGPLDICVAHLRSSGIEPTLVMDISAISKACGVEVAGILGMPFLKDKVIQFKQKRVRISNQACTAQNIVKTVDCSVDCFGRLHMVVGTLFNSIDDSENALIDTGMNQHLSLGHLTFGTLCDSGLVSKLEPVQETLALTNDRIQLKAGKSGVMITVETDIVQSPFVHESESTKVGSLLLQECNACVDFHSREIHFHSRDPWSSSPTNDQQRTHGR